MAIYYYRSQQQKNLELILIMFSRDNFVFLMYIDHNYNALQRILELRCQVCSLFHQKAMFLRTIYNRRQLNIILFI